MCTSNSAFYVQLLGKCPVKIIFWGFQQGRSLKLEIYISSYRVNTAQMDEHPSQRLDVTLWTFPKRMVIDVINKWGSISWRTFSLQNTFIISLDPWSNILWYKMMFNWKLGEWAKTIASLPATACLHSAVAARNSTCNTIPQDKRYLRKLNLHV